MICQVSFAQIKFPHISFVMSVMSEMFYLLVLDFQVVTLRPWWFAKCPLLRPNFQAIKFILSGKCKLASFIYSEFLLIYRDKKNGVLGVAWRVILLKSSPSGGDAKTLMICQVSPAQTNVVETLSSLNFASRARNVELGQAKKTVLKEWAANIWK